MRVWFLREWGGRWGAACTMTETKLAANLFSANTYTPLEKGLIMMKKCVFDMLSKN